MTHANIRKSIIELIENDSICIDEFWKSEFNQMVFAGECLLALESVEDWIVGRDIRVSKDLVHKIEICHAHVGQTTRNALEYIKENLVA